MLTFIWITEGRYNLLDAHQSGLPREGWQVVGDCLYHGLHSAKMLKDNQPSDPYLLNAEYKGVSTE